MAKADAHKVKMLKPNLKVATIACKFKDTQTIDSKGFNRVQFVG